MSREDKKRKVAPHVPQTVKVLVHEVAVYLGTSDGDAGARLVMAALSDYDTLCKASPYLLRAYGFRNSLFPGYRGHANLDDIISPAGAMLERLPMRFVWDDWAALDALGFALGRAVAHAAAALLNLAYTTPRITNSVAPGFFTPTEYALQEVRTWDSSTRPSASRA